MTTKSHAFDKVVKLLQSAREYATIIMTTLYTEKDIKQIETMKSPDFYGYASVDIERIMSGLNVFQFLSAVLGRITLPNEKGTIMNGLEQIEKDLQELKNGFEQITSDELTKHQNKPFDAVNELEAKANSLIDSITDLQPQIDQLDHFLVKIRNEIERAHKLLDPNTKDKKFKRLEITKHFTKTLPSELGFPKGAGFKPECIQAFDTIWRQPQSIEIKIYENILMKLQANIDLAQSVVNTRFENHLDNIKIDVILKIMELRYLAEQIYANFSKLINAWYDDLKKQLKNVERTSYDFRLKLVISSNGEHVLSELFKSTEVNIEESLGKIESNVNKFLEHLAEIKDADGFIGKLTKFQATKDAQVDAKIEMIKVNNWIEKKNESSNFGGTH